MRKEGKRKDLEGSFIDVVSNVALQGSGLILRASTILEKGQSFVETASMATGAILLAATLSRDRDAMRHALKRLYSDQILYAKLGRPPSAAEASEWFKNFYTNPPCACNRRAKACTTKCTTCGDCVNKNDGGVFEHTEALLTAVSKLPGDVAFLARMRASDASGEDKYLVAWHRPCTQCNKCNKDGLVAFVDRSKLAEVAGAAERKEAATRKASKLSTLFGYSA